MRYKPDDDDFERLGRLFDGALIAVVVICAVVMVLLSTGCATCDPVVIRVPVDNPGAPLPEPATPEWQTPTADPAIPVEYLRALTHDLLAAWTWGAEMRHVIEAHNTTIAAPTPVP